MASRSKVPPRPPRGAPRGLALGALLALTLALTLAAGSASAQPTPLPANPLPWSGGPVLAPPVTFDGSWANVLSDTLAKLKVLADLSRYGGPIPSTLTPAIPRTEPVPELRDQRTYVPTNPDLPTLRIGPATAQLTPVSLVGTQVAAESRGMQAVLIGLQIPLPFLR